MSSNQSQLQRVRHDIKIRRLRVEKNRRLERELEAIYLQWRRFGQFCQRQFR